MKSLLKRLIHNHRERELGNTGVRDIRIEVERDGKRLLYYLISHAWQIDGETCQSLFLLQEPHPFDGTAILMTEMKQSDIPKINLHLRTSKNWLQLDFERAYERILGTDFSYNDVRFWLPLEKAKDLDTTSLEFNSSIYVNYPATQAARENLSKPYCYRVTFDQQSWIPVSITYYNNASSPIRIFKAESLQVIDGIWTPTLMSASIIGASSFSKMNLLDLKVGVKLDAKIFDPQSVQMLIKDFGSTWLWEMLS
ncbi:outer membrane lipoprotein-sorting protein [Allocoleopsis sp.]|uniref:outer membrane lipoprotein-sorting protein n=1 Tax=Allocoleopsis sp. TaxID=3088169 RepID=UPI002FD006A6